MKKNSLFLFGAFVLSSCSYYVSSPFKSIREPKTIELSCSSNSYTYENAVITDKTKNEELLSQLNSIQYYTINQKIGFSSPLTIKIICENKYYNYDGSDFVTVNKSKRIYVKKWQDFHDTFWKAYFNYFDSFEHPFNCYDFTNVSNVKILDLRTKKESDSIDLDTALLVLKCKTYSTEQSQTKNPSYVIQFIISETERYEYDGYVFKEIKNSLLENTQFLEMNKMSCFESFCAKYV